VQHSAKQRRVDSCTPPSLTAGTTPLAAVTHPTATALPSSNTGSHVSVLTAVADSPVSQPLPLAFRSALEPATPVAGLVSRAAITQIVVSILMAFIATPAYQHTIVQVQYGCATLQPPPPAHLRLHRHPPDTFSRRKGGRRATAAPAPAAPTLPAHNPPVFTRPAARCPASQCESRQPLDRLRDRAYPLALT
jgi:hypothetical protein